MKRKALILEQFVSCSVEAKTSLLALFKELKGSIIDNLSDLKTPSTYNNTVCFEE